MRFAWCIIAGMSILLPACPVRAAPADLRQEIGRFAQSRGSSGLSYCVAFSPAGGGSPIIEENAERLFPPASLTKLVTAAHALETLGPGFTLHTRIYRRGPIRDGILEGDILVQGGGDPFLVSERLWLLARSLAATGLREVRGDLILDNSLFATAQEDPARDAARGGTQRPYAAVPTALTVNFNAACFLVRPGPAPGDPAVVLQDPMQCGYLGVDNGIRTIHGEGSWSLSLRPAGPGMLPGSPGYGETATAAGSIRAGTPMRRVYRSVADPEAFAGSMTSAFLEDAGICITGSILTGTTVPGDSLLVEFPSLPLAHLVSSMNRYSNNLMADMIAMQCGTHGIPDEVPRSGSLREGMYNLTRSSAQISAWLRERFGAGVGERVHDGSGLHPDSRIAGITILRLLVWAWNDLAVGPDFAASLPRPGTDGTLRRRFGNGTPAVLAAKTGTHNDLGVSALAGYVQEAPGRVCAFVIIMQSDAKGAWSIPQMQALQERWLATYLR